MMWSRTKDTVKSTFNRMRKDCKEANEVLSVGQIFPRMGNSEMVDKDGMGLAIIMLHASLRAICSVSLSSRLVLFEYWCSDESEHSSEILLAR